MQHVQKNKKKKGTKSKSKQLDLFTKAINGIKTKLRKEKPVGEYDIPQRATHFRQYGKDDIVREMRMYAKHVKDRYLVGLVHPDLAVQEQIPVKLYSDLPIPTASVGWHEQYNLSTSTNGTFLLNWSPGFFVTQDYLDVNTLTGYSGISYNNSAGLTGNVGVAGNSFVAAGYTPNAAIQKYRLVSALIKVSYNGNVLNQSGTMISCCEFDRTTIAFGSALAPVSGFANPTVDRFGNFSLINNGLWNTQCNITEDSRGMECLYVPLDPEQYIFESQSVFRGASRASAGTATTTTEGAYINYVIAGRNLPVSTLCIIVDIFYNYEVIADTSAAPLLRSAPDTVYDSKHHSDVTNAISTMAKTKGFIKKSGGDGPSFNDVLKKVASLGATYIPKILSML
jgi:hypothetical protein